MLKIGDFSALTLVSIKTLRYYDELGLLEPLRVDPKRVTGTIRQLRFRAFTAF
jgi:DNA-binding transcriptional MerR regulator